MPDKVEWIAVRKFKPYPIGAIGFIGNNAVAIASFFDDADGNQDGKISAGEWIASKALFNLKGKNIAEVAMQAAVDPDILMRDASIRQISNKLFLSFASGLVMQGVYTAYFARGVGMAGSGVAKMITNSMVKQLVIRKGFEAAVKKAFTAAVAR